MRIESRFMKKYVRIAERLFIKIVKDFNLIYKDNSYCLANEKEAKCHLLEICLIVDDAKCTGNKLQDIKNNLGVNYKWILGFYDASQESLPRFSNKFYLQGFREYIDLETKNVQMQTLCS